MTAPYTETTSAWPQSQASETIKLYQEGIMAGTCGAATLSLWFLILDILAGHPLSTPHVLGTALFTGGWGVVPSAQSEFSLGIVVACTGLHWLAFALMGGLASRLLGLASRLLGLAEHNPNLGFGVLLLFVLFEGGFLGGTLMFAEPVLHALAWQSVLVGNLFAAIAMGGYLWRRHSSMVMYP
jgi:hypothetical protein